MEAPNKQWYEYMASAKILAKSILTTNFTGEYAEILASKVFEAQKQHNSKKSYDLIDSNGKTYQVKSGISKDGKLSKQLSSFRTLYFDYLVVVVFNIDGNVIKAVRIERGKMNNFLKEKNKYQNAFIVKTSKIFYNECSDFTDDFRKEQTK